MTKLVQYIVVAPLSREEHTAHVHRQGCHDLRQSRYRGEPRELVEASGPVEAALEYLNADDLGYTADDVRVFPCCQSG